jgi:putative transposase
MLLSSHKQGPMARHGRYFLPDQPLHVIQRGNNRSAIFFGVENYDHYRNWLAEAAAEYGCLIHVYLLMTNHVHLLLTPERAESLPRTMRSLGRRYVRAINAAQRRSGTLWEGRYRAAPINSEAYFLACCRYIELNPVRACMVVHPADYRWSSYRAHAHGAADALVSDHPLYHALGRGCSSAPDGLPGLVPSGAPAGFRGRAARGDQWWVGARRCKLRAPARRRAPPARHASAKRPTAQRACRQTAAA